MLEADIFCSLVEASMPRSCTLKDEELRLKLSECPDVLAYLQGLYEGGHLTIGYRSVPEAFRHLVMSLMWVAFHRRRKIDFDFFRELIHTQEILTLLLIDNYDVDGEGARCANSLGQFLMNRQIPYAAVKPSRCARNVCFGIQSPCL